MSNLDFDERDLAPGEQKPGATEWEDALIKHNIVQGQTVGRTDDDDYMDEMERIQGRNPHEQRSTEELKEMDPKNDAEEDAVAQILARRRAELMARAKANRFGQVFRCGQVDYVAEVSKASNDSYVVCHLADDNAPDSAVLGKWLPSVAAKHRAVKFVEIRAQDAIPGFPTSKCPTLLIYKDTHIVKQIEGLGIFGGAARTNDKTIEWVLAQPFTTRNPDTQQDVNHRIVDTELTANPLNASNKLSVQQKARNKKYDSDDDDDDD